MHKVNVVVRKLADLHHPELNIRLHPDKQITELKRSIEQNGQTRLIVIDENNVVWIGNGLMQAMIEMGLETAHCLLKEGMTDKEKKKMMASDNRIFELGVTDMDAFDQLLKELGTDLDVPGFDPELLNTLTADLEEADEMIAQYGLVDEEKKEEIVAAAETYEKKEENFAAEAQEIAPASVSTPPVGSTTNENEESPQELSRRFLVCPKCGERIWL